MQAGASRPNRLLDSQAIYRARLRASGLRQVAVWVPADRVQLIRAEATRLRADAGLVSPVVCDRSQLSLFSVDDRHGVVA